MAKICTNEKAAARQRWIENGLMVLMQEQRFEEITVTELCRYLHLSRRSFYRYFGSIEDVLESLLDHTFQEMAITDSSMTVAQLENYYEFWRGRKELLDALANSGMTTKIVHYALKYADEVTLQRHLAPDDLDARRSKELNLFIVSGLSSLLIGWHSEDFRKPPGEMAKTAYRMLYEPLLTKK